MNDDQLGAIVFFGVFFAGFGALGLYILALETLVANHGLWAGYAVVSCSGALASGVAYWVRE